MSIVYSLAAQRGKERREIKGITLITSMEIGLPPDLILHATLHANFEIRVILAILEIRKPLFPNILGFSDHPHTVEVVG